MGSTTVRDATGPADRGISERPRGVLPEQDQQPETHPQPTQCRTCGAVFREGRWQWLALAEAPEARRARCPACLRVRADDPAGVVTLVGVFVRIHGEELDRLIRREEAVCRQRDPQSRIMRVRRLLDRIDVATTDLDLPRRIGEAVERAYGGTLDVMPEKDGSAIRVRWLDDEAPPAPGRGKAGGAGGRGACTSRHSQRILTAPWPSTARSMPKPSTG